MPEASVVSPLLLYTQLRYCTQNSSNSQLCALRKLSIAHLTPQFLSHLLTLYLGYNQQQISMEEYISREGEQDFLGREERCPTVRYIFC